MSEKKELEKVKTSFAADATAAKKHRTLVEDLATRRFFYVPAYEIYGGVGGLFDYGPPGCTIRDNILAFWRQHFVYCENMLEVGCVSLTPEIVLKTSGHVDRFTDYLVKDAKRDDICLRADKLIEEHIDKMLNDDKSITGAKLQHLLKLRTAAGAMGKEELMQTIKELQVKSPDTGNDLSEPYAFNLMFGTQIGPTGKSQGFMRPETAQGIFVNFRRLYEYNANKMPFAAAQIGSAFRNEIAPRSGLIRVREFTLAEIEHFVNPNDKSHPKFKKVCDTKMFLLPRELQTGEDVAVMMTAKEAVHKNIINNETLAYFMVRTQEFLHACGIKQDMLRFRQHKKTEMAHYAKDCWDAEVLTTYGWVECVGHADRAAFDLSAHGKVSKVDMSIYEQYPQPREVRDCKVVINKAVIGKQYKNASKALYSVLEAYNPEQVSELRAKLEKGSVKMTVDGTEFTFGKDAVQCKDEMKMQAGEKYVPSVIEPSFGIGRIMYAILEQSFTKRDEKDDKRVFLALPPIIAPYKVAVLPLSTDEKILPKIDHLAEGFAARNVSYRVDTGTAQLGRKYARCDEIGIPFAVTVDFDTLNDNKVTIRERNTMCQIRIPMETAWDIIQKMSLQQLTWEQAYSAHPHVERKEQE